MDIEHAGRPHEPAEQGDPGHVAHKEALARVRLLALDVDGTLTDGRVTYAGEEEIQSFCVRDGQGLAWLKEAGVELAWITGRGCRATGSRHSWKRSWRLATRWR